MKLKSIHILIIILIVGSILFLINTTEKYANPTPNLNSKVVILNSRNTDPLGVSVERENNITCDTSNPNYPMCLDIFTIKHPRTITNVTD
jgi:hypothetical protein